MRVLNWLFVLALVLGVALTLGEARRHRRAHHKDQRLMSRWDRRLARRQRDGTGDKPSRARFSQWLREHMRNMFSPSQRHAVEFLDGVSGNPFFSLDLSFSGGNDKKEQPWWKGPNVCESETEEHHNESRTVSQLLRHFMTSSQTCDASETAYKCKFTQQTIEGRREVTVIRQCCHGYSRQKGDKGCPRENELYDLQETAQRLGLTDFVRAVRMLRLTREFQEGNFTVFAPVNGAFGLNSDLVDSGTGIMLSDMPSVISVSEDAAERAIESLQDAILGHMTPGSLTSSSLEDEQVLETGHAEGSTIRINYFNQPDGQLMTVNCVPVESRDEMATNGVIHTISRAMKPVTTSLLELVKQREDLSTLKTVLASAEMVSTLDEDGSLTLLAPTNAAFKRMNPRLRQRLLNGDKTCIQKVLQNHLLPNVICTEAVKTNGRTPNLLKKLVNITRTDDGKLFTEGSQVVQADVMATNGVMHVIDDVIVPDEALGFVDILEKMGFTELLALVEKAGLSKTFGTTSNVTVFAPTNEAIQKLPRKIKSQLASDAKLLKEFITFHVSPGVQECHRFHDNQLLPTLADSDIRINNFHMNPLLHHRAVKTAQCVPIQRMNVEACNGRINVLEDVMRPPQGNVIDVLALDKRFSTLVSLAKKAGLADVLQGDGPYTIFAPNNEAFSAVSPEKLDAITGDPEQLKELIKRHVFQNTLCCAGIVRGNWFAHPQVRVMSGDKLKITRDRNDQPKIAHAAIVTCDRTATNGNVLEIDSLLLKTTPKSWIFNPFSRRARFWP